MTDQPTACVDPEVYNAAITFHTEPGQHRIMYTTNERLAYLIRLHGERVSGHAMKLATGAWTYAWRRADGVTQARILLGEFELEQFVRLDPTKDVPGLNLPTDDLRLLTRCRAAADQRAQAQS